MPRLEACYFCGTAEDTPLRAVTVTPRRQQGDPDAAVTLTPCRSCERKLERVLGELFEHVESRRPGEEAGEPTADPAASRGEEGAPPEPVDRIDVSSSRTDDGPREGRRRLFEDPPADDGSRETGGDQAVDSPAEADVDDAEVLDEEPRVHARATASPDEALDGVSVSEYNRVLRLLSNRQFPMGRGAFVDLAANAYDLREETVEQVLDAVIDQGTLSEREGQLVRPGDEGAA